MLRDYLKLHGVVFLWGFTSILGNLITLSGLELTIWRTLLASVGMVLFMKYKKLSFRLSTKALLQIMGTGILVGAHWVFFFHAAKIATVSVCLAGVSTTAIFVLFLESWFKKTRISKMNLLMSLLGVLGLYLIFKFEFNYWEGLIVSLIAAFLSALFGVINSLLIRKYEAHIITLYELISAMFFTWIVFLFYTPGNAGILPIPAQTDWLYLFILAWACTVYAFFEATELLNRLSSFVINLYLNLEPVYGMLLAILIFREDQKMTIAFYAGMIVILLSVMLYPITQYVRRKKANNFIHNNPF